MGETRGSNFMRCIGRIEEQVGALAESLKDHRAETQEGQRKNEAAHDKIMKRIDAVDIRHAREDGAARLGRKIGTGALALFSGGAGAAAVAIAKKLGLIS